MMKKPLALASPDSPTEPQPDVIAELGEPKPRPPVLPWLYAAGFAVMAATNVVLWLNRDPMAAPPPPAASVDLDPVMRQVQAVEARLAKLEQRPATADAGPLVARIDALEKRSPPDLAPLVSRITALEQRQPGDPRLGERVAAAESHLVASFAELQTRIAALENRPLIDPQFAGRVDALAGRVDALSGKTQTAESELTRQIDATTARLGKIEGAAGQVAAIASRTARLARLQSAEAALSAGLPLGTLPGAPPALARFATARPPTEAGLRLAFPATEKAVRGISRPDSDAKPFLDRIWDRTQQLVTVRQGDNVLVGDTSAGVLARARVALDAGDLSGAVTAMGALTGDAGKAAAPWVGDAKALLDARAALAEMAAKS